MVAVFEPKIIEVVGEAGKTTVRIHALVPGGGAGVGDMLEGAFDVEAEVVVDEEFEPSCKLRGKFPIAADRFLVRPVSGVGIDHACAALNVGNNDPVGLDEIVAHNTRDARHVGSESFPDIRASDFKECFKVSAEGSIAKWVFLVVRRDEHPSEADIVLLVVEDGFNRAEAARGEHNAGHKFQGDPVFHKEGGSKIASVGHRGQACGGIRRGQGFLWNGGRAALLHLGVNRGSDCE